nr:archaetidylserine decarboxylase [Calditerricola satsumensis]
MTYRVRELLGSAEKAAAYEGGAFVTLYLSPRDYHRIHMPVSGWITEYCYVPGTLFPVNPFGVRCVDGLFAKNERLITYIRTDWGEVAVVKVGATMVGSVCVTYDETVRTNVRRGKLTCRVLEVPHYAEKGEELGYFTFGSTVIVLFPRGTVRLRDDLCPGQAVRMGEPIGRVTGM